MTKKKKLQVFVSSTYLDLKAERQAAVEAILKAGHIPAGMELFAAGNESQLETIRRWIDESDVYMLILGGRYGSVDSDTQLSYTELEYDYAISVGKPVFSTVISQETLNQKVKANGQSVLELERPQEMKLFREKVLGKISSFFSDEKDIKLAVHETLADFQFRFQFSGWVSGEDIPEITVLLSEISKMKIERDAALRELSEAKKALGSQLSKPSEGNQADEFNELIDSYEKIEITSKALNQSETDPPIKFSLMKIVDVMRDHLISGVSNNMGMGEIERLLFYNVLPKLELHGLSATEKVAGVAWRRYKLTEKGKAFLVNFDKRKSGGAKLSPPSALSSTKKQAKKGIEDAEEKSS